MKKLISLFVAVLMVVSMFTISASADFTVGGPNGADSATGSHSANVTIEVNSSPVHKYAIDIVFDGLKFTYSTGSTWNPTNHQYDVNPGGKWSEPQKVVIKNHSDQQITYAATVEGLVDTWGTLAIELGDNASGTVDACTAGTAVGSEPNVTISVTVSGTPNVAQISNKTLGSVKVAIS